MRLIDADELKVQLENAYEYTETVEPEPYFEKAEKDKRIYEQGFKDGQNIRPQGEWARHDEWRNGEYIGGFYHINCPEIEKGIALFSKWETNYCPNCGASMKKGGAE